MFRKKNITIRGVLAAVVVAVFAVGCTSAGVEALTEMEEGKGSQNVSGQRAPGASVQGEWGTEASQVVPEKGTGDESWEDEGFRVFMAEGDETGDTDDTGTDVPGVWDREWNEEIPLPEAWDYRTIGRAPQIGNQGALGTCWAFASLKALESSLLPEETMTFSVDHMSMHNSFLLSQDEGGEYPMSMAYLLGWQGPVLEVEDPYGDGYSPDGLKSCWHVQEIQILPSKDYEAIKRAVYIEGGVQSALYTSMKNYQSESVYYNRETNSYCYTGNEKPNHDSVIVGWDDNYPKENFNMDLEGDGAFICTNSWGEQFGEQGYFYVSYYDSNIGVHNIVYTGVEPVDNYDKIYQSDLCGWIGQIGYGRDSVWFANAYVAGDGEELWAAGFYATGDNTEYEIYVARHLPETGSPEMDRALSSSVPAMKGRLSNSGFYTVPLEEKILLDDFEKFAIIIKITTPGTVHPAAIEFDTGDGIAQVDLTDGEGYLSSDGQRFEHVEETQKCNVCLKAYTKKVR